MVCSKGAEKKSDDEAARYAKSQEEIAIEKAAEEVRQSIIAREKAAQAFEARNELTKANDELAGSLARSLRGPIGVDSRIMSLTPYEVEAIRELAARRGGPVSYRFLDEATQTPLTCKQFANRAEFVLQATIGLDPELRSRAEKLLRDRLGKLDLPAPQRLDLALVWHRSGWSSPETDLMAAEILAKTIGDGGVLSTSLDLTEALAAIVGRLDRGTAAELCEKAIRVFPQVMERSGTSMLSLNGICAALGPLADRLDRAAGGGAFDTVIRILIEAVRRSTEFFDRTYLAETIAPVAMRVDPRKIAELCDAAILALLEEMRRARDAISLNRLARDVAAISRWMEPTKASTACTKASEMLIEVMGKTRDNGSLSQLAWGLSTVAIAIEPNASAIMLTTQITNASDSDVVAYLAHGLVPVLNRLEPVKATEVCEKCAGPIARALSGSTAKLSSFANLAEGLAATAVRLQPARGASLCTSAASNIARRIIDNPSQNGMRLDWLSSALVFLVPRMEPGKAADLCGKVVPDLAIALVNEEKIHTASRLAQSIAALAFYMPPGKEAAIREQAARGLVEAMSTITSANNRFQEDLLRQIVNRLAASTLGIPAAELKRALHSTAFALIGLGGPYQSLPAIFFLPAPPRPLPAQKLVDLMKLPFCVGKARRVVLNAHRAYLQSPVRRPVGFCSDFAREQVASRVASATRTLEVGLRGEPG